ncbi:hypothetical protein KAI87_17295, partial [Myxococcota bacterium]|nr:hypothetical protein [Myxococcota bacterium]
MNHKFISKILNGTLVSLFVFLMASNVLAAQIKMAVLPAQFDESAKGLVPKLFDDYLMSAVQNHGNFEVIGQDDINTLLGFDEQKDLMGCDDTSCIADIGGALGVDRIVAFKIARLGEDWVVTSKLINIREAKVESRSSDFVSGNVKSLLKAVPSLVAKLLGDLGRGTSSGSPSSSSAAVVAPVAPTASGSSSGTSSDDELQQIIDDGHAKAQALGQKSSQPTSQPAHLPPQATQKIENHGVGARVVGMILGISGLVITGFAMLPGLIGANHDEVCYDDYGYDCYSDPDWAVYITGALFESMGMVLTGVGTNLYINGKARKLIQDPDAYGKVSGRWLAWVLMPVGIMGALVAAESDTTRMIFTVAGVGGGAYIFASSMWDSDGFARTDSGREVPFAVAPMVVPDRDSGTTLKGLALRFNF